MPALNPLTINLHGFNLIEASAGTGKTYTLTSLYLRLLLERNLDPSRILVVTFTEAATEALRERVRYRIAQALQYLERQEHDVSVTDDPFLSKLVSSLPQPTAAKAILVEALARMDEAAIYTIHSFCYRMLQDYAFESGSAFNAELITNEIPLQQLAVEDVWRRYLQQISLEDAFWIKNHCQDPSSVLNKLKSVIAANDLRILPPLSAIQVKTAKEQAHAKLEQVRSLWKRERAQIVYILENNQSIKRISYQKPVISKALAAMDALVADGLVPEVLPPHCDRLTSRMLNDQKFLKPGATPPTHPFFDLCTELERDLYRVPKWQEAWCFQEFLNQIRAELAQIKAKRDILSFDDLLKHLDLALADTHSDQAGSTMLAAALRKRFPVALIDEFQDTDPKQYRIFRQIYADCPKCGLFLIGDPKQAIYAFRGADVFTYMQAKDDAARSESEYTLATNWRSSTRLVRAVNTLFSNIPTPFSYNNIPFQLVEPSPRADCQPLIIDGNEPIPLQFWLLAANNAGANSKSTDVDADSDAKTKAARACAEYIAALLQAADAGRAKLGSNPVRSQDIAVLVRSHAEGKLMQEALRACNVTSVTGGQESIFATKQAQELNVLLTAIARPTAEGLVRTALATVLLGWNAAQLDKLYRDETRWEEVLTRFQEYHSCWLERGFVVAFQRLLKQERIASRLLRRHDGERWLTNILQLAELLQAAAAEAVGLDELLRWFASQLTASDTGQNKDQKQQLRLESDEGLVKIVTIHKSKGLEYPIVFIPFPWSLKLPNKKQDKKTLVLFHDPVDATQCLDLGSDNLAINEELQHTEIQAENMRLFYVALTRAARLCILCWGKAPGVDKSAPAILLHPQLDTGHPADKLDDAGIRSGLMAIAAKAPDCIAVIDLPAPNNTRWAGLAVNPDILQAAQFKASIPKDWSIASYSGLIRNEEFSRPDHDGIDSVAYSTPESETDTTQADPIFAFPAGAKAGLFLHSLLERLPFPKASGETLHSIIEQQLHSYGDLGTPPLDGMSDWGTVAAELITNCLDTTLTAGETGAEALRLRTITWDNRLNELEFNYQLANLTPKTLRAALANFPSYRAIAEGLEFKPCHGLMRGFIDLIFRHQGRYYIADYKSNRLGEHLSAYNWEGMDQAMRSHHYDLQYLIYVVAVHKFLTQRLFGYDYDQHFGGVYYLFLRGMRPSLGPDYGVYFARPPLQVIEALANW